MNLRNFRRSFRKILLGNEITKNLINIQSMYSELQQLKEKIDLMIINDSKLEISEDYYKYISISDYKYCSKPRPTFKSGPIKNVIESSFLRYSDDYEKITNDIYKYKDKFSTIYYNKQNEIDPYWNNNFIPYIDAAMIYSHIVEKKPFIYLEVGSGNTTKFAAKAVHDYHLSTKIISIDPEPRAEIDSLCNQVIRKNLEDIDISIFNNLSSQDIVIVDNSHRAFPNSDVTVFFTEILPILPSGVVYAIHDIALPNEIYCDRYYNEQYMLATWLLGGGGMVI